jgi:hypothetical protein
MSATDPYRHVEIVRVEECASCNRKLSAQRERVVAIDRARRKAPLVIATVANFALWNGLAWWQAIIHTVDTNPNCKEPPGLIFLAIGFSIFMLVRLVKRLKNIAALELPDRTKFDADEASNMVHQKLLGNDVWK